MQLSGGTQKECTCSPGMVSKYQKRISGPLLDRIDIHLEVPRMPIDKLASRDSGEPFSEIRARVKVARFAALGKASLLVNGDIGSLLCHSAIVIH